MQGSGERLLRETRCFLCRSTGAIGQRNRGKPAYYGQIMSFFSEPRETAGRYGKYLPEFQELFRSYGVSFGTPKDFLRLPSKLAYDGDFRVADRYQVAAVPSSYFIGTDGIIKAVQVGAMNGTMMENYINQVITP